MSHQFMIGLLAAAVQPPAAAPVPAPATAPVATPSDPPPPVASTPAAVGGARTYTPADFARFAPKTALEMLNNVPGFTIRQQDDRRGLGQATANVILNGERFSGKSNDVVTELGRISADIVTRIEIVDGATLDIPGLSGQVANIVTASKGISGSFAYRPEIRTRREPALLDNGEVSVSGKVAGADYTVALTNDSGHQGNAGPELVIDPTGTVLDRRAEVLSVAYREPKLSVRLHRQTPGGTTWNVNGSGQYLTQRVGETSLRSGPGQPDRDRELRERLKRPKYEVSGDYEFRTLGGKLKVIGLRRGERTDYSQALGVDFADATPDTADRYTQHADEVETIGRAEFRWKGGRADWQLSGEAALNSLSVANALFTRDPTGTFQPVPFPDAVARVEEKRGEGVLSYGRPLSKTLSLQSSLGVEYSELAQSGPAGLTRSFIRPKGQVALAWKPAPKLDLSLKLERAVGQLSFFDFVASGNIAAETTNAGNANLVPPQSWDLTLQGTRDLGRWGTILVRGAASRISDIVDVVPIGVDGQAPGNLDSAVRYSGRVTATINFDPVGWKGAKLDLDLFVQHSRLTDPLTGERRPVGEDTLRSFDFTLRYDIPKTDWAVGASGDSFKQAYGYRLDQRTLSYNSPTTLQLFAENKDVLGLTVRGSVFGLTHTAESFDREFYDGRRTNPLLFTETRRRHYGLIFNLAVTGKF